MDAADPFSEESLTRVRAEQLEKQQRAATKKAPSRNNGQRRPAAKRRPRQPEFLTLDLVLLHRLNTARANPKAYALVWALSETWFTSGFYLKHLNPLPLSTVDTAKWELSRKQRSRALLFLVQTGLITVNRHDRKNPLVTLNWAPIYPPEV